MQRLVAGALVACILVLQSALAARILGVFAHPARSNSLFAHAVMATLAAAGHDVTVYSPFKPSPGSGFRHVHIYTDFHRGSISSLTYENFTTNYQISGFGGRLLRSVSHQKCDSFLGHPKVQQLLHSKASYDLVFTCAILGEEALLVFGHVFKAPTINLLPINTWSYIDYTLGNAMSMSFSPEVLVFPFTHKMSLIERAQNALSGIVGLLAYHWYDLPAFDSILRRHASSLTPPPPSTYEMVRDIALTFINVHPAVSYPKPMSPNIVLVGGIHIESNSPPLSQEIKELMDSAVDGVIFCSLGSIVPVDTMPLHFIQAYIEAFRKFPQKVIWKFSAKNMPDLPDNVMISPWLPQQQILEHPNLRVFLTHGGLGSQLEALKAGVPVVGLPFVGDQPYNVEVYKHLGVGVSLSLKNLSTESITEALQTVLSNKSYAENARRVARIYADQPLQPAASVVYWTEYILRHGGAHLRPQAALLPWYQRALLDVAGVVLVAAAFILTIGVQMAKIVYRLVTGASTQWKKKNKNE